MSRRAASIGALLGLAAGAAAAQGPAPTPACASDDRLRPIYQASPDTGTSLKRAIANTRSVPFDKRYHELTPAQKACVRENYDAMPEGDEPPFPRDGMQVIVNQIASGYDRASRAGTVMPVGTFEAHVKVGGDGRAVAVQVFRTFEHHPDFVAYIASVLMSTPYKPAVCGGRPCTMSFPFVFDFTTEHR